MKIMVWILVFLVTVLPVTGQEPTTHQDEAAQAAWRGDIDYLLERLTSIHPNPFYRMPETEIIATAARLKADLPHLTENQIIAELARISAMLDGHTYLFLLQQQAGFHLYPIRLYAFDDGIYVINAAPAHEALIGARLLAVNGLNAQVVFDALAPYSSSDNLYGLREWVPMLMVMPELLQATGIIESLDAPNFTFLLPDGETATHVMEGITLSAYLRWNAGGMWEVVGLPQQPAPLYLSRQSENFWHELLEDTATLYIQYNHVYRSTASGMTISGLASLIEDSAATGDVDRLVIDLRHNGGGDNTTYLPLLRALQQSAFNQPGRLFVLTGRSTFSAAKDFTSEVADNTHAVFVGEPTGGMPNNYGDTRTVRLPNSGLEVGIATRYVPRGQSDGTLLWFAPDVAVPVTAADFFAGRDAALEAALTYEPGT